MNPTTSPATGQKPGTKKFIVMGAAALITIIVLLIFLSLRHRGEIPINIDVAPVDSTITINDEPAKRGTNYLKPGEHTIKASREYFTDDTVTVNTNKLERGQTIYLLPGADTPEALQWLRDNPQAQLMRERISGGRADANAKLVIEKYPFIQNLPYITLDYKIDYSLTSEGYDISFQVTLNPVATLPGTPERKKQLMEFKDSALQYLQAQGIDTKTADITFNPDPDQL